VDEQYRPIETPLPQRVADFKRRYLPVIVWSVAALACVWLMTGRANRAEYIGLARSVQYQVSTNATGEMKALLVDLYDRVEAGDLLAKLDDSEVLARVEQSRATIRQLGAELDAARAQLITSSQLDQSGWHNDLRRFETDEEDRRLAVLELRVTIESDEIELERLALELRRAAPVLEAGLIGQQEYDNLRMLHDTVQTRLEENKVLLQQIESEYRTAVQRREAFEQRLPSIPEEDSVLRPLREAIGVETMRLREIEAQQQATLVRSPVSGQVSSILCRPGQTVRPGWPILTIAEGTVTEILAFLDEADGERARENTPVLVASLSRPEKVAESVVVRLGPDVEMLPERLWRAPSTPEYGRAVIIAAVPGLELKPGELLSVKLLNR
jgi:multidrug resistance efflux pump